MAKAMITEAEHLRDAFSTHDNEWLEIMMEQFVTIEEPRKNVGARGWLWQLSDGTALILNDSGQLIATPTLRGVR